MKKNTKKRTWNKLIIIVIILTILIWNKNNSTNYQANQHNDKTSSSINITNNKNSDSIHDLRLLANENPDIEKIIKSKNKYPEILLEMLSRNLDMTDYVLKYLDYKGQVFSNNIGKVTKGKYPLLLQYDSRWGYGIYGDEVLAINGCGPTSLAMVIAGLTGRYDITPYDVAIYSYQNGHYANGTSWSLFTKGVKNFGIVGTELSLEKTTMMNELEQNHPIICSMRAGDFTTTGHIIAIVGIKDGKFIINDPNSKKRSDQLWAYEKLKPQIKNLWSFKLEAQEENEK